MRKYEVDRVHNSKDDEIYQIAQSVEQKVRTGMLMPDYEMGQKPFHHWGDVILNYTRPSAMLQEGLSLTTNIFDLFQTTFTTEERMDGNWYVTTIKVDAQCLKLNKKTPDGNGVHSSRYAINFLITKNGTLEFYNYNSHEFDRIIENGDIVNSVRKDDMAIIDKSTSYYTIKLNLLENKSIEIRYTDGFIFRERIKAYNTFSCGEPNIINRGLIISYKKKWILIEDNNIDNICVKHGGMKYINRQKTVWKLTKKNVYKPSTYKHKYGNDINQLGIWYNGYTKPRFGRRGERNGNEYKYLTWIKCYWLDGTFTPIEFKPQKIYVEKILTKTEIVKLLLRRRHARANRFLTTSRRNCFQIHFLKANIKENCFELWNFTITKPSRNNDIKIIPIFLKNIPPEAGYYILHNRNKTAEIIY